MNIGVIKSVPMRCDVVLVEEVEMCGGSKKRVEHSCYQKCFYEM